MLTIDGSMGEGGGQILRTSLSLSAITGTPVEIEKIRAGRETPGLKRQHLTCAKAVAEICGAKVAGDAVGSCELEFTPGKIEGGDYRFDVGTAGCVLLVAQTVIPVLLKADAPSTVTISGGTHVSYAPIWEFFESCYLPELRRMGAKVEAELVAHGFYPAAGGEVKLRIWPYHAEMKPESYALRDLGAYRGGSVVGVVSAIPEAIAEAEAGIVAKKFPELNLVPEVRKLEAFGPGNYCCAKLDYERASVVFSSVGAYGKSRKAVANEVVTAIRDFLKAGKACEKHLADQLLVPAAVFLGERLWSFDGESFNDWSVEVQKETKHFMTNQSVINKFLAN
ncbi:MAG: RNA 3'-terminal phosphate cyclase [Kiritimatiellia bacterium]